MSTVLHRPIAKGRRRWPCDDCDKSFDNKSWLAKHRRVHTNERPFPCPLCACKYRERHHVKMHVINCHHMTHREAEDRICEKTPRRKRDRRADHAPLLGQAPASMSADASTPASKSNDELLALALYGDADAPPTDAKWTENGTPLNLTNSRTATVTQGATVTQMPAHIQFYNDKDDYEPYEQFITDCYGYESMSYDVAMSNVPSSILPVNQSRAQNNGIETTQTNDVETTIQNSGLETPTYDDMPSSTPMQLSQLLSPSTPNPADIALSYLENSAQTPSSTHWTTPSTPVVVVGVQSYATNLERRTADEMAHASRTVDRRDALAATTDGITRMMEQVVSDGSGSTNEIESPKCQRRVIVQSQFCWACFNVNGASRRQIYATEEEQIVHVRKHCDLLKAHTAAMGDKVVSNRLDSEPCMPERFWSLCFPTLAKPMALAFDIITPPTPQQTTVIQTTADAHSQDVADPMAKGMGSIDVVW